MTFLKRLGLSLLFATTLTLGWAVIDWIWSSGRPWDYGQAFLAAWSGGMVAGPWRKKEVSRVVLTAVERPKAIVPLDWRSRCATGEELC